MAKVFVGLHAHFGIPLKICVKPSIVKIKKVSTSVSFGCVTSGPPKLSCCKRWFMCSCLCGLPRQFWLVGVGGLGGPHAGLGGSAGWLKAGVSPLQVLFLQETNDGRRFLEARDGDFANFCLHHICWCAICQSRSQGQDKVWRNIIHSLMGRESVILKRFCI